MRLLLCLMAFHTLCYANTDEALPQTVMMDKTQYLLCKQHTIRKAFVIKIAHVGLYLQNCDEEKNIMQISDKLVRFNYQVGIKSDFFKHAAYEYFVKNITGDLSASQKNQLNEFNQLYQDIKKNDCYDLYHKAGQQLSLYKNSQLLGTSLNSLFSKQYFTVWFGQYPAVKKLKKAFLPSAS